jgi:hypothetical protein
VNPQPQPFGSEARLAGLVDEHRAAELLDLCVETLRRWRRLGRGPHFRKLGTAVRYAPADLIAFVQAGERSSTGTRVPGEAA